MIRSFFKIILLVLSINSVTAESSDVAAKFNRILSKYPKLGLHGISILESQTGKIVYEKNGSSLLNPASALKVLISGIAFDQLGLDHVFKTQVKGNAEKLCLIGGGDPSLVQEQLYALAEITQQRLAPQKAISELIVDDTLFKSENPYDPSFSGDAHRAFTADIGALSTNFNSIGIRVEPTALGAPGKISITPDIPQIKVKNTTRTTSTGGKKSIGIRVALTKNNHYLVHVFGNVSIKGYRGEDFFTLYASIPSKPALFSGYIFADALNSRGLTINNISEGRCPNNTKELFTWDSKPLSSIIRDMNIYSNNFIAETLLRHVTPSHDRIGGIDVMRTWIKNHHIKNGSAFQLDNASGLSRKNQISANTLAHIFHKNMSSILYGPEFLSSLSINGLTGTMKNRLKGSDDQFVIRGKSGTLNNAVSLVGRAQSLEKDFIFSFIFNNSGYSVYQLQNLENTLLKSLLESP
ncbi:MAG: D-alanyl-D-alanine carboxypeptidase/D-alanyl-D-alanine-endopeptidase [Bdellovibrionales bacterium]|nr:D-alanyl-D-alanine carboxypeptidase/D-alanyl-D-alanine-endopeptidase [Bdellovibrionales bacterium]